MPFKLLGLSDPLVRGILATGYTAPTEIQSQVIPAAISASDAGQWMALKKTNSRLWLQQISPHAAEYSRQNGN